MKSIRIIFKIYQMVFASNIATCRFRPTCSEYAQNAIEEFGLVKGSYIALKRLLSCHPLSHRPIIDPIPTK